MLHPTVAARDSMSFAGKAEEAFVGVGFLCAFVCLLSISTATLSRLSLCSIFLAHRHISISISNHDSPLLIHCSVYATCRSPQEYISPARLSFHRQTIASHPFSLPANLVHYGPTLHQQRNITFIAHDTARRSFLFTSGAHSTVEEEICAISCPRWRSLRQYHPRRHLRSNQATSDVVPIASLNRQFRLRICQSPRKVMSRHIKLPSLRTKFRVPLHHAHQGVHRVHNHLPHDQIILFPLRRIA
jgi:hypothetical protein